jgi:hypothetical protein
MPRLRIYQPSKTTMQAGRRKRGWHVAFETTDPLTPSALMGWVSSSDMTQELSLSFPSLEEALHFANLHGFSYTVCSPGPVIPRPKNYALNFTCPRMRG